MANTETIEVQDAPLAVEAPETPEVQTELTQEPAAPQYTETEKTALSMGWKPKDQWEGNPEDHRSAKEFLDRGELLGKLRSQGNELREMKDQLRFLSEHQRKTYQAGYEQGLKELKAAKVDALERGDHAAVVEIEDRIDDTKQAIQAMKQVPQKPQSNQVEPTEITKAWVSRNSWYMSDRTMRNVANQIAVDFAHEHNGQVSEQAIYEHIDREIKRIRPDLYEAPKTKPQAAAPSPDGESRRGTPTAKGGNTRNSASGEFASLIASFPAHERRMAENLVQNGYVSEEQFVKDFKSQGRS